MMLSKKFALTGFEIVRAVVRLVVMLIVASGPGLVMVRAQLPPDRAARALVQALKETPGGLGQFPALATSLEGAEEEAFKGTEAKALGIALSTTGEHLDGTATFQAVVDIRGWFMARRPLSAGVVAKYLSRYGKVDRPTVEKWRAAQGKSGAVGNSPTLTLSAIVFQEYLWEGGEWKKGNPDRALTRLASLSSEPVSRWGDVASKTGSTVYGSWTLLAVDDLFVNDIFQRQVFDAVLPLATKLINSR